MQLQVFGQAIAIRLAQEGCNIAINYPSSPEAAAHREQMALEKACGNNEATYISGQTLFVDGGLTLYADFRENWSA